MWTDNSGYLFLLLLIPFIIHLLSFVKTKKIYFSRISFLQVVSNSNYKLNKLTYFIVLVSRILGLFFLILSVVNILFTDKLEGKENKFGTYFLDNSLSLLNTQSVDVLSVVNKKLFFDSDIYELTTLNDNNFNKEDQYFLSSDIFKERINNLKLSSSKFDLSKVITRYDYIKKIASLNDSLSELILLSDFQKPLRINKNTGFNDWRIIKIDNDYDDYNIIIDSVWLTTPFVGLVGSNDLKLSYSTTGNFNEGAVCKLYIDAIQVASSMISTPKGNLDFNFVIEKPGNYACKIEVDDNVIFDNTYFFTITAGNKIPIAIVSDEGKDGVFKKVYSNESSFLTTQFSINNLSIDNLSAFDVVIFDNVKGTESISRFLKNNAAKKTLVYIPPVDLDEEDLFFIELKNQFSVTNLVDDTTFYKLNPTIDNEFLKGVFSDKIKEFDFTTSRKMIVFAENRLTSLITYQDKSTFLAKKDNMYVFSAPLNTEFSRLHHHALFVPIMYHIAMSSTPINNHLSYYIDELVAVSGDFSESDKVSLQSKDENILLDFSLDRYSGILFDPTQYTLEPGIYNLMKNDSLVSKIAFNLSKSESIMEFYSEDEIKNMFPGARVETLSMDINENRFKSDSKTNTSIWKYYLTLSLMMFLIEIILIKYLK